MWRRRQSLPLESTEPAASAPRFDEEEARTARPVEPLAHEANTGGEASFSSRTVESHTRRRTRASSVLLTWAVAATVVAAAALFYRGDHGDTGRPSQPISTQGAAGGARAEDSPRPQPGEPSGAPVSGGAAVAQDATNVEKPATRRPRAWSKGRARVRGAGGGGPRKARLVGVISG